MFKKEPIPTFLLNKLKQRKPSLTLTEADLSATEPKAIEGRVNTSVFIRGNQSLGITGAMEFKYAREDIGNTFRGIFPDIPIEGRTDVATVVGHLNSRYGTKYDHNQFELSQLPNTTILQAKPDSYEYIGKLALRTFYSLTELGGVVVDETDINKVQRDARHYSYGLSFAGLGILSEVVPGDAKQLTIVANALEMETMDPWKAIKKAGPYNLYGAEVISNEAVTNEQRQETHLLQVAVNPKHCTNFTGTLVLYYSIPELDE